MNEKTKRKIENLQFNPKRLVTFTGRFSKLIKFEMENAKRFNENDYLAWLQIRLEHTTKNYTKIKENLK
jgi:hypothetical protein